MFGFRIVGDSGVCEIDSQKPTCHYRFMCRAFLRIPSAMVRGGGGVFVFPKSPPGWLRVL